MGLLLLTSYTTFADQKMFCTASSPYLDLVFESETLEGVINRCSSITMDKSGCTKSAQCKVLVFLCTASSPNVNLVFESETLQGVIDRCSSITMDKTGCRQSAVCSYQ